MRGRAGPLRDEAPERRARHDRASAEGSGFADGRVLSPCHVLCPGRPCLGRGFDPCLAAGRPSHCPSRRACAPCASPCAASSAPPSHCRSHSSPSAPATSGGAIGPAPPTPKLCTRDVSCKYATPPRVGVGEGLSSLQTLRTITQNMDSAAAAVSPGSSTEDLRGHIQRTTRKEARRRRAATTWTAVPAGERTRSLADGPAGCRRRPALLSS